MRQFDNLTKCEQLISLRYKKSSVDVIIVTFCPNIFVNFTRFRCADKEKLKVWCFCRYLSAKLYYSLCSLSHNTTWRCARFAPKWLISHNYEFPLNGLEGRILLLLFTRLVAKSFRRIQPVLTNVSVCHFTSKLKRTLTVIAIPIIPFDISEWASHLLSTVVPTIIEILT